MNLFAYVPLIVSSLKPALLLGLKTGWARNKKISNAVRLALLVHFLGFLQRNLSDTDHRRDSRLKSNSFEYQEAIASDDANGHYIHCPGSKHDRTNTKNLSRVVV